MKNSWPTKTLGEVCQFRGGGTPSKAVERYWRGNIPWVSPKDMKFDVVSDSIDHISQEAIDGSATSLIPKDSVLMVVRSGILARTVPLAITGRPLTINQDLKALCPTGAIDARFLYHLLDSRMDVLLSMVSRGATVHRLTTDHIRALDFVLPPLPEQKRIVAILDEAFEGIATAKVNAEKNLENARALFESHLQSVFTQRGKGWKRKPLGALCQLISGQHIDANDYNTDGKGVGYLTGPSDFGFLNPIVTKWSEHPKRMAKRGDILVTVKGSGVGKINLLDADEVAISRQLMAVRVTAADISYLYAFLSTNFGYFQSLSRGAAIPGISREDVLGLMCPMPPPEEQASIVRLIRVVAENTQRLGFIYKQKLAALDALKKSLLHQAFTGQLGEKAA